MDNGTDYRLQVELPGILYAETMRLTKTYIQRILGLYPRELKMVED
jgi:hypothetical protein